MTTCQTRRVGYYEDLWFYTNSCANQRRVFAPNVRIEFLSSLHSMCLCVPSMCTEDLEMNCGSRCDKRTVKKYMLNKQGRALRRAVVLHQQLRQSKKASLL